MEQILKSEDGFTLLEALLSLFITTSVLLLILSGILQITKIKETIVTDTVYINHDDSTITGNRQIEWHIFLNQLERYLQGSRNPTIYRNRIKVEEWDESIGGYITVEYRRPESNTKVFVRSVNNGNQRMLIGAHRINFEQRDDGWLMIHHSFDGKEDFYGKIWVSSWAESEIEENLEES